MIAAVRVAGSRRKARSISSRTIRRTSSPVTAGSAVTAGGSPTAGRVDVGAGRVSSGMGHLRGGLLGAGERGAGGFGPGSPGSRDVAEDRFACPVPRSEERRVGKECRSRWSPDHENKKGRNDKAWHRRVRQRHERAEFILANNHA